MPTRDSATDVDLPCGSPARSALREWIANLLGTTRSVVAFSNVLYAKTWGSTILCHVGDLPVVLKIASPVIFPGARTVYRLLNDAASDRTAKFYGAEFFDGAECSLFQYLEGRTAKEMPLHEGLLCTAQTLGTIQRRVAKADVTSLPAYSVEALPHELAADLDDQSPELRTSFEDRLDVFQELANQLQEHCFRSLDHPDVNPTNVVVTSDRSYHIIDWEEAAVGCPLFSLDRVLDSIPSGDDALETDVRDAYLEALGACDRSMLRVAAVLVPLRRALEARQFARAVGRADPHTRFTARLIATSLERLGSTTL